MLGVGGDEKEVGRAAGAAAAEAAPVFSLEDLIVPTTSSHGFQALGTPPLPKNWDSTCGKRREEILRQLQELTMSEAVISTVSEELEPVAEFQSWASEHAFQQGYAGPDIGGDITNIVVPIYEDSKWNLEEYQNPTETLSMQFPYEQYPLKSAEGTVSSLVEISDICAGTSNGAVGSDTSGQAAGGKIAQILPSRVRHDLPCPDRGSVISRYKEKRKTRRYEKLIRYESRKARADSRLRIKGRFAKMNQADNN
ncbi:zinc finger protein CONSTANS-LIKE 13-like [Ananas comosus]|uniref:Zinc finger protein CONSTANS-LIKE 13-like n=1 Tax=Ananas comosus TaxID=4615 RepID=A0A6P5GKE7_ANACO|nr:zinc finger protein CONSTANS-LIKE 13-like [Ananas comosus]